MYIQNKKYNKNEPVQHTKISSTFRVSLNEELLNTEDS